MRNGEAKEEREYKHLWINEKESEMFDPSYLAYPSEYDLFSGNNYSWVNDQVNDNRTIV